MQSDLEVGFYWVKDSMADNKWEPALFNEFGWTLISHDVAVDKVDAVGKKLQ